MNLFRKHTRDLIAILLLAFVLQVLEYTGVFASAESRVADFYLRNARPSDDQRHVVTVGLNDEEYAKWFNSTSPLDPVAITQLVATLLRLTPRVVGVDILTEWDETDLAQADLQNALGDIRSMNQQVPVVWASSAKGEAKGPTLWQWLMGHHDTIAVEPGMVLGHKVSEEDKWGVPVFPLDHDRSVRRFPRTWSDLYNNEIEYPSTFARVIASEYCSAPDIECQNLGEAKEVFLSYESSATSAATDFLVGDLFECVPNRLVERVCKQWQAKIGARLPADVAVVLGGVFKLSRDFYPTPLGENTPGLVINARAVEAEIKGPKVFEASRTLSLVLDILVGCIITAIFTFDLKRLKRLSTQNALALRIISSFVVGCLAIPFSFLLFKMGVLWLSWVGMLLTILSLHVVLELFHHNEPHEQNPRIVSGEADVREKGKPAPVA